MNGPKDSTMDGPKARTYEATNREVAMKGIGGPGLFAVAYGVWDILQGEAAASFLLVAFVALLFAFPWVMEGIDRMLMWRNTRGYHADE